MIFQSTLPVGGATPVAVSFQPKEDISIHAPRGGSDVHPCSPSSGCHRISIHAPRGGSDIFISSPAFPSSDFNPRSPWGERPRCMPMYSIPALISIHAPRGGSDIKGDSGSFQCLISIHAPRGGSDHLQGGRPELHRYFNPRSPWGERPF